MTKATGSFEVTAWNEETYEELHGGGKLTRASVQQSFTGDIVGEGAVECGFRAPHGPAATFELDYDLD